MFYQALCLRNSWISRNLLFLGTINADQSPLQNASQRFQEGHTDKYHYLCDYQGTRPLLVVDPHSSGY